MVSLENPEVGVGFFFFFLCRWFFSPAALRYISRSSSMMQPNLTRFVSVVGVVQQDCRVHAWVVASVGDAMGALASQCCVLDPSALCSHDDFFYYPPFSFSTLETLRKAHTEQIWICSTSSLCCRATSPPPSTPDQPPPPLLPVKLLLMWRICLPACARVHIFFDRVVLDAINPRLS
jgi:hypothetical protein